MSLSQCVQCGALYQAANTKRFYQGKCKVCLYFYTPISSLVESDDWISCTDKDLVITV